MTFKTHSVLGLPLARLNHRDFQKLLDDILTGQKAIRLITIYSEYFVRMRKEPEFHKIMHSADILIPDGIGPIWTANFADKARGKNFIDKLFWLVITGVTLVLKPQSAQKIFPARLSGSDIWLDVCHHCEKLKLPIFLLGRKGGLSSATEVKTALQKKFPELKIDTDFTEKDLIPKLQKAKPKVILCGFGTPDQDYFLAQNLTKIKSARLGIGLGASFDFLTGKQKRAPKWMQNIGLEWLWRLLTRPGRWRRIYTATIEFVSLVWKSTK